MNYDTIHNLLAVSYGCWFSVADSIAVIENAIANIPVSDTSFLQVFYNELENQSHVFSVWQGEVERLEKISKEISEVTV